MTCCPVESTFVFTEAESPGSSNWDRSRFRLRLHSVLVSADGHWRACNYDSDSEGAGFVLLCARDASSGMVPFARAMMWDPAGARLLLDERAADDDCQLFHLDIGGGERAIPAGQRMKRVFGERALRPLRWEGDSVLVESLWDRDDSTDPTDPEPRWVRLPATGR